MSGTVGYIGLGEMGGAMSKAIAREHELVVFDLSPDAIEAAVEAGAIAAESGAELAVTCDHIGICVPDDAAVEAVVTGDAGILDHCREGTTIAVHSTVHPDTVRELAAAAAERGVVLFDAGVAGGSAAAAEGNLSITVGVPDQGLTDLARTVLDTCGGAVFEAGPLGAGMAMKLAFNVMTYFQQAAASAAHQVVVAEGGDHEKLLAAWRHVGQLGALTEMFYSVVTMAPEDKSGDIGAYFENTIYLAEKDLDLAADIGSRGGRRMPVVESVRDEMRLVYGMPDA